MPEEELHMFLFQRNLADETAVQIFSTEKLRGFLLLNLVDEMKEKTERQAAAVIVNWREEFTRYALSMDEAFGSYADMRKDFVYTIHKTKKLNKPVMCLTKPYNLRLGKPDFFFASQGVNSNINMSTDVNIIADPLRLLRATNAVVIPARVPVCFMSSSEDITHSWAVPGLGIKMDCVPGRLFSLYNIINREGVYFGQCSELCGVNHYNMPINLYVLSFEHFLIWWELEFIALNGSYLSVQRNIFKLK